jgi:hypothetical protein
MTTKVRVWQDDVSVFVKHGVHVVRPMIRDSKYHHPASKFRGKDNMIRDYASEHMGGQIRWNGESVYQDGDRVTKKHFAQTTYFLMTDMCGEKEPEVWFIDYNERR